MVIEVFSEILRTISQVLLTDVRVLSFDTNFCQDAHFSSRILVLALALLILNKSRF